MLRSTRVFVWLAVLAVVAPAFAVAAEDGPLTATLVALKPGVDDKGAETLTTSTETAPGQIVIYRATFHNKGEKLLKNVVATVPVPAGVVYIDGSAKPAATEASVDGQTYFLVGNPPKDTPATSWKFLRWSPYPRLSAGAEFVVELRTRVVATQ